MKNKWDKLIYIDLFSGSGYAQVRGMERIVQTSPLIALSVTNPFDHCIFSEYDDEKASALEERVRRDHPHKNVSYYVGDTNSNVDRIYQDIDYYNRRYRTLCFCFVDPFSLNLNFETIHKLSTFNQSA